jgi:hypothetical protein
MDGYFGLVGLGSDGIEVGGRKEKWHRGRDGWDFSCSLRRPGALEAGWLAVKESKYCVGNGVRLVV